MGPRRQEPRVVPRAVRRPAAAPVRRAGAGQRARSRVPRRDDHRARPGRPPGRLGPHPRDPRARRDRGARHALHGGGRAALRPRRGNGSGTVVVALDSPQALVAEHAGGVRVVFHTDAAASTSTTSARSRVWGRSGARARAWSSRAAAPCWRTSPRPSSTMASRRPICTSSNRRSKTSSCHSPDIRCANERDGRTGKGGGGRARPRPGGRSRFATAVARCASSRSSAA